MKKIKVYWKKKSKVVNNKQKNKKTNCMCYYESTSTREETGKLEELN